MECRRCGRLLTDPKSKAAGIGPVCAAKENIENMQEDLFGDNGQRYDLPFNPESRDIVCKRFPDGKVAFNFPQAIKHHSPTGMEWGYAGSGPADFALNCLLMFVPEGIAREHYQNFKFKFVATLPREGGVIQGSEIRKWLISSIKDANIQVK